MNWWYELLEPIYGESLNFFSPLPISPVVLKLAAILLEGSDEIVLNEWE